MLLTPEAFRQVMQGGGAPPPPRFFQRGAAVAVLLRFADSDGGPGVLLMRRVEHPKDPWSGHVSLPGGRAEPGDGSAAATASRETEEEVGVDLARHGELLGHLPPLKPLLTVTARPLQVVPVVFLVNGEVHPEAREEAQRVFWLPLETAAAGALDSTFRYRLGPISKEFPCWRHDGEVIWGLTYRVLRTLLSRVARLN